MRSNLIDLAAIYQTSTERAVCVREHETSEDVWLPLSLVEVEGHDTRRGSVVTITGPEKLFSEKGLT